MVGKARSIGLIAVLLVAACGASTDAGSGDIATSIVTDSGSSSGSSAESVTPEPSPDSSETDSSTQDAAGAGDPGGLVDGSGVDWATVDLTTIDWEAIDVATVDFQAISFNPTAADLDEATASIIASRIFPGSATLTIGGNVWVFDNFVCAFGYENTESEVYSFSSNSFGTHSDGTRVQMQADIRDDSGADRFDGDGLVHESYVNDIEDFDNPVVSWQMSAPTGVSVDGDTITVAGEFDDTLTDEAEAVAGTLEAECGTLSRR